MEVVAVIVMVFRMVMILDMMIVLSKMIIDCVEGGHGIIMLRWVIIYAVHQHQPPYSCAPLAPIKAREVQP